MNKDNKRIAKNTIILYGRTFITMIVGIYTSRVLLEAVGIDNYGIINVVGGLVSFSAVITGVMSGSISRYLNFHLGKGDIERLKNIFSTSILVQSIIALGIILVFETAGLWFLNAKANIPADRLYAANWVLQFSILTTVIGVIRAPFEATIISHERMSIYAYMSVIDVSLKLGICYIVLWFSGDKLILYTLLIAVSSLGMSTFYCFYSSKKFEEVCFRKRIDKELLKEMTGFSGWSLLNNTSSILSTQGISLIINIFFGVAVNAARGIANTVNSCVQGFVYNFTVSFNPMITKSYAAGNYSYCYTLVNRSAKFTWLMMLVFIVPICVEADTLLHLWLVKVPNYATIFLQLSLFEVLAVQVGNPLFKLIQANGNIKKYSIEATIWAGMTFPMTWIAYKLGAPVWSCYIIYIVIFFSINFVRLRNLKKLTSYEVSSFFLNVIKPCGLVTLGSFIYPLLIVAIWSPSLFRFFIITPTSVIITLIIIYWGGLDASEKSFVNDKMRAIVSKFQTLSF